MKKLLPFIQFILFFFLLQDMHGQGIPKELLGVWKYEISGIEAMGIFTPTHAGWVGLKNDRVNLNGLTLSAGDKTNAYHGIWDIGISTLTLEKNNRCKTTFIQSHNLSNVGQSYLWDFEVKDGYFTYWIIRPDGSRGFQGKARKIAGWEDKSELSEQNGLWKYLSGINGYYLHCGNYAMWFIVTDPNLSSNTDVDKAHVFESINCAFTLVQKQNGIGFGKGIWHTLMASDIRNEKSSTYASSHRINKDFYDVWIVDGAGKPIGNKWQIQRISK